MDILNLKSRDLRSRGAAAGGPYVTFRLAVVSGLGRAVCLTETPAPRKQVSRIRSAVLSHVYYRTAETWFATYAPATMIDPGLGLRDDGPGFELYDLGIPSAKLHSKLLQDSVEAGGHLHLAKRIPATL
ncbi:hypothetical protein EVAR_8664_1 [Eumeta japonica]|uniref:Uncharacterized protein n=1 Tax=Eumeta variegata TaxID=151549 RepID=A0A4C1TUV9_EUMVA|nr:hypothetical protein EVAR_8664_1 [Eumeta japonica]